MSTSFSTLKTNVGNRIGDTSTTMATIIGTYINQRYKDVLRRTNWNALVMDYVVTATAGTKDCTLPTNFGKELYVWDSVNATNIPYLGIEKLEQEYQTEKNSSGIVEYYSVYNSTDNTTAASAARCKKLRLWRTPATATCFEVPYTLYPSDLSATNDELVYECERAVEYGATSDAWLYKRQFQKANYYESLYEKEIQNLMWNETNQPNQQPMMNVQPLNRDEGI